ncbi:MAG: lysophospholipid acyltransferase family protein [Verrucomicrobiota bacterium]
MVHPKSYVTIHAMPSASNQFRYFLEYLALSFAFVFIPKVPRPLLLFWSKLLGSLAFLVHKDGRRTAICNLHAAFPGRYTDEEIEDIAHRCYRSWARTYLDQFWTKRLTLENFGEYICYQTSPGLCLDEMRKEGAIWMTPHYGNFEWGAAALAFLQIHYTAIAQPFKNPKLTPIFLKNREHLGHHIIPQEKAMLKLLRVLNKGGHAAFLPDLTVPPDKTATIIRVFGFKVSVTPLGPFLAQRTSSPIVCGLTIPLEDGSYLGYGFPPFTVGKEESVHDVAQACWDVIEPVIASHPEHWLWMYKHFRFRPELDGDAYPPYSSRSPRFDELEASLASNRSDHAP